MRKQLSRLLLVAAAISAIAVFLKASRVAPLTATAGGPTALAGERRHVDLARLPISFAPIADRADHHASFVTHTAGLALRLMPGEADLSLGRPSRRETPASAGSRRNESSVADLKIRFLNANQSSELVGIDRLPGVVNYYLGHDRKNWRSGVRTFARVENRALYPGIDLVYYGNGRRLEYDLNVAADADVSKVQLAFSGAEKIAIEKNGDVTIRLDRQFVYLKTPVVYQLIDGRRRRVDGRYVLRAGPRPADSGQIIGMELGKYDPEYPVVIDPVLSYSTYLGGAGVDSASQVALDSSGNNYLAGVTCSSNFPTVDPAQASAGGNCDAFVTEINSTGTTILYSTYLGGSGFDTANSIAVDQSGAAYVAGQTESANFPTTVGPALGGISNAFVTKLNPNGTVAYSRFLGSDDFDVAFGIALEQGCSSNCNAYVVGRTNASDFPTTAGVFQPTRPAGISGWVTQLSSDGTTLVYSTYLGGPPDAELGFSSQYVYSVAVDGVGDAYVTGGTIQTGFPVTERAAQDTIGGGFDCFVTKLNAGATQPVYSTFLGGSGNEGCLGIALVPSCTSNCNAYVTGFTSSSDLATTSGAAQPSSGGIRNGLVAELNASGTEFLYTSYLGGYFEDAFGIAVDNNANAYVAGETASSDFPTVDPIQSAAAPNGILYASTNGFATFAPAGLPASDGVVHDLAVDGSGAIYAGTTHHGLFKSANQGTSFSTTAISTGFVSALAFDQSTGTLYAGLDSGLVKSTDGGATFTANALPAAIRVISIDVIPCVECESGQSTILAGTVGQGIFASFDGGATFGATPSIPGTSVLSLAYDPNDLSIVYAGTNEGLFQSTDGGATFNSFFLTFCDIEAIVADGTTSPSTFYLASGSNLIGVVTTNFSNVLHFFEPSQNFFSLAIDPSTSPPTAYAASDAGDIYVSTNRGASFAATSLFDQPAPMTLVSVTPSGEFAANFLENDATLTEINPAGTAFTFSTYLQGASQDAGLGVAVEPNGTTIHVVGQTASSNFPVAPSPGAVQTAVAGLTDAFLAVFGPPMSVGGMVPPPPPPTVVSNGKAGGTVGAGSLTVSNTSGAPLLTPSVNIEFNNADLFTSATLTATVGTSTSTSTVVPKTTTTFTFNPPVMIPLGQSVTYSLSATITLTPNITRRERPVAYASILPLGGSRRSNALASVIGAICALAMLTAGSGRRRLIFAAALMLLLVSVETGCDNGTIGTPNGPQFSTQTARDVAAKDQTGGPVTIGGLPVVMSHITVP